MRRVIGRPRTVLIVAPHPDDEVIGAAGLIARLVRRRVDVRVTIVTDGAASHPHSRRWPRRRLIAERQRESRRALRRLGIPAGRIRFLRLADGGADSAGCRLVLAAEIRRLRRLDLVVGPALDDAHPDHRTVAAGLRAVPHPARRLAYRVWRSGRSRGGRRLAVTIPAARKRSLIRMYRTQLGLIRDDPAGFTMARHEVDGFARGPERFMVPR